MPPLRMVTTYLFGYENDNPSAEFLKYKIFGQKYGGTIRETYYTKNLKNAKSFFAREITASDLGQIASQISITSSR